MNKFHLLEHAVDFNEEELIALKKNPLLFQDLEKTKEERLKSITYGDYDFIRNYFTESEHSHLKNQEYHSHCEEYFPESLSLPKCRPITNQDILDFSKGCSRFVENLFELNRRMSNRIDILENKILELEKTK